MNIGERIIAIRKELKLTQKEFGDKIGVAANTITNYEAGRRDPMEQTIKAICREFNVNYDWIKNGVGEAFESLPDDIIASLVADFELDELDQQIILGYLKLTKEERAVVRKYMTGFIETKKGPAKADPLS